MRYHFHEGAVDLDANWTASAAHSFLRTINGHQVTVVVSGLPEVIDGLALMRARHEQRARSMRRYRTRVAPVAYGTGGAHTEWEFLHESLGMTWVAEWSLGSEGRTITVTATCEVAVAADALAATRSLLESLKLRRLQP